MYRGNERWQKQRGIPQDAREGVMSLDELPVGKTGRVVTLEGGHVFRERVSSMGLRPGARVEVLRRGRATPLLVAAGHARLALGQGMSEKVMVKEDSSDEQVSGKKSR